MSNLTHTSGFSWCGASVREIGYQKTTVADIAKVLRMSPANVYRFFDSKKAIHEGVARALMGGVEQATEAIAARPARRRCACAS